MSGYTICPCRDCFEVSMDNKLCHGCAEHGCSPDGDHECLDPNAYGCGEGESITSRDERRSGC